MPSSYRAILFGCKWARDRADAFVGGRRAAEPGIELFISGLRWSLRATDSLWPPRTGTPAMWHFPPVAPNGNGKRSILARLLMFQWEGLRMAQIVSHPATTPMSVGDVLEKAI